jgi:hypothetical protein
MNDTDLNSPTPRTLAAMQRVASISPVDGWALLSRLERDGDGFPYEDFFAARGTDLRALNVSRFRFSPTQERFAWLVCNAFPAARFGSWDSGQIDAALAVERRAA